MNSCICNNCFRQLTFIGKKIRGDSLEQNPSPDAPDITTPTNLLLLQQMNFNPQSYEWALCNSILKIVNSTEEQSTHSGWSCIFNSPDDVKVIISQLFQQRYGMEFQDIRRIDGLYLYLEFVIEYKRPLFFNTQAWITAPISELHLNAYPLDKFETNSDKWDILSNVIDDDILFNVFRNMLVNLIWYLCRRVRLRSPEERTRILGPDINRLLEISRARIPFILNGLDDVPEISDCLIESRIKIN